MKIISEIATNCPCYKEGTKIEVKGLMLHSVGCAQPSAKVFVGIFSKPDYEAASVHAFIDANDGSIHKILPWNRRAWHCGGYANSTHIGVEMCEPPNIKYIPGTSRFICTNKKEARKYVKVAYDSAVELFAYLCKKYNLDPLKKGVIISHNEGAEMGWGSSHGDPEHLWKGLKTGYTMDGFRKDVKKAMASVKLDEKEDEYMFTVDTIKKGDIGNDVKLLQRMLKSYGYKDKSGHVLEIDGNAGESTVYALKKYQTKHDLTADGVCGPKTWKKLLIR